MIILRIYPGDSYPCEAITTRCLLPWDYTFSKSVKSQNGSRTPKAYTDERIFKNHLLYPNFAGSFVHQSNPTA